MNNGLKEFITAVGAMAEFAGLLRDKLMDKGFTRQEAVNIVSAQMLQLMKPNNNKENK